MKNLPIRMNPYTQHDVFIPESMAEVSSRSEYIGINHISEFTDSHYNVKVRDSEIGLYSERRAYRLFGKLLLPQTIQGRAIDRLSVTKVASAYRWNGLDIQAPTNEDIETIRPIDAVLSIAGLLTFVSSINDHPEILEKYMFINSTSSSEYHRDRTPDEIFLFLLTSQLERVTHD
jgi:hypothetical protein